MTTDHRTEPARLPHAAAAPHSDGIYLRATGVRLPDRRLVADALAAGECDAQSVARTDVESVTVSSGESAAEMAVAAARQALERAGSGAADVGLILHADVYHQGQDMWPVASYIQRQTVRNRAPAVEIRQMSNGGLAGLDLARSYLLADRNRSDALVTAGDRFCLPGVDRWRTDPGTPYADGAAAVVLSRRGGFARVVSIVVDSDSDLEEMHRGDPEFGPAPFSTRIPIDFGAAKQAFTQRYGMSFSISRTAAGQRRVVKEALAEAGLELADARWVILPHFGRRRLDSIYFKPLGVDPARTTWDFSRTVGHLGAADQFASLDHLAVSGLLTPGDHCLLVSVGAGYTWAAAVIEVLDLPGFPLPAATTPTATAAPTPTRRSTKTIGARP